MLYEFDHQDLDTLTQQLNPADASDEQLMARIQLQDEIALATFFRRHHALLRTIISKIVHTDADVDDALQDVMIELWNRCPHYEAAKGKALGWVITLARRRAIDRIRRRQSRDHAEERMRLQTEETAYDMERGADEKAADSDRATLLREIIATLPDAQRQALELAYFRGLSQREIARETGIPLGTIKTRLELAVRKIRGRVLEVGGMAEWSLVAA